MRETHRPRRADGEVAKTFADGRYEVVETIASGGFGTVYKALDHNADRNVAIKVIKTDDIADEQMSFFLRLFQDEAQAAGRLDHAGIVPVYDHDPYASEPFLVMPFVAGGTLAELLAQRKKLPWQEVIDLRSRWPKLWTMRTATVSRRIATSSPEISSASEKGATR